MGGGLKVMLPPLFTCHCDLHFVTLALKFHSSVFEGGIRVPGFIAWPGLMGPSCQNTAYRSVLARTLP